LLDLGNVYGCCSECACGHRESSRSGLVGWMQARSFGVLASGSELNTRTVGRLPAKVYSVDSSTMMMPFLF
jgi:hypothetical protein